MSDHLWYWRREGTVYGPVDAEAFKERIETGQVGRADPARPGRGGTWQRIETYPEWASVLEDAEAQGVRPQRGGMVFSLPRLVTLLMVVTGGIWFAMSREEPSEVRRVEHAPLPSSPPLLQPPVKPDIPKSTPAAVTDSKKRVRKRSKKRQKGRAVQNIVIGSDTAPNDGGLSAETIAKGFRRGLPRIQVCAKRYATGGGQVPSKMAVSYSIRNSGSVTEAKVRPHEISQTPLGRCIVGVLRRLQYPSYRGEARTVSFPLAFNQK